MMDNNTQQVVYEGKSDLESFCFHQQSKQIYFTVHKTLYVFSVAHNRVVDEFPVPVSVRCSVSSDGQLLILLSPFPENQLRLYRFVSLEHELVEVTNVTLPTPKYINESLERLYNRNQDLSSSLYQNLQTPYEKAEFVAGSNTHIILLTKFTVHVCKVQINTGYTYLNIQQILSNNDPRNKNMLFSLYLVNNLLDLLELQKKSDESSKSQRKQDSLEFYQNVQTILNQFTEKQLQSPLQQLDHRIEERHKMQYLINKQVQNSFEQLNKQVISPKYNRGTSYFQYTGFRYNIERILEDKRFFESVFEFCDFTGQYEVLNIDNITYVFVADKNLGIMVFCLQNNQSNEEFNEFCKIKAMFLDLDYSNFQQDISTQELTPQQIGLEFLGSTNDQGIPHRINYVGDSRLMAISIGQELIDCVLPIALGFQDSSIKRYEIFVSEKPTYDLRHTIQPSNVTYYYALGCVVSMVTINLEQSSTIYGILNSNKVIFVQFSDFLAYVPAIYTEETDQFSIKKPKIISDYLCYSLERLRHMSSMISATYHQQVSETGEAEKKYWDVTLRQLDGSPQYLSSYHTELMQTPTDQPMSAEWQMFVTDDGYEVTVKCLVDGRIILSSKNSVKFITARCPINALDQSWLVPDGILAAISVKQQKLLMTAHVSGYLRIFAFQGDGTLKLINRLRLSQMPLTHICISSDLKDICVVDAQHIAFFVNNVSENNVVTGYFNIKEVPNLTQLNKQNMYKLTLSYNEYMNQMLNVLIYKECETFYKSVQLPANMDPAKQTYNMNIINFQQAKQNKEQAKQNKDIAQKILNGQDLGNSIEAVKPLPITYQNKYLKSMFQYIVQIRSSGPFFYFVLATGEILKITIPSPQRHNMAMDNVNAMQNENLLEKLNQMTDYELRQIETKFLQIQQENHINVFDEMEYSIIKTGLAISEVCVDIMVIAAPYNVQDLLYIGTYDGKVFIYSDKPVLKQPGMNSKLDFPLLNFPVMQLETPIQQISITDNILMVSDSLRTVITPCILPTSEAMKKQSQACLKNDELQPTISGADLSLQDTIDVNSQSSKFFVYAGVPGSKIPRIINQSELLILARNGTYVRAQLNEIVAKTATDNFAAYNSASQQFLAQFLSEQSMSDVAAQNKNLLKAACDMRQVMRDFKLQQSDLQTLQQQLLSLQPFVDGPLRDSQLIAFSVNQHFCKQATQAALDELCGVPAERDCGLEDFDLKDQEKHVRAMNARVRSRVLLVPLPARLECGFLGAARLFQLVAGSYLRYKQNLQLVEEAVKVAELAKDVERQNYMAIKEKGLLVLPKKASMTFLTNLREENKDMLDAVRAQRREAVTEAELVNERPQTIEKIIAASSIINEQEIRVSPALAGIARRALLQRAAEYERQFKSELLAVKTFQNTIKQQKIDACEENALGEAVCGINDRRLHVAAVPVPRGSGNFNRKAKKMAMLRAAQLVSERMAPHLPPALVRDAEGRFGAPTEQQLKQQQMQQIQEFKQLSVDGYKPISSPTEITDTYEIPESRIAPEDPFRLNKAEDFASETLLRALELGATPQLRALHVPYQKDFILSNAEAESDEERCLSCEQLLQLINNVPAIRYFYRVPTPSLRRCCFLEAETAFQVRAVMQMYLLKAITLLLIKDVNQRVAKAKEEKFKQVQTITEKINQIIDIGKELTFHAREEIMTELIAQQRKKLFDEYQAAGVALEECAERAARNAPSVVTGREKDVDERAFKKLDETGVLDLNKIVGYSGLKAENKVESLKETLKIPALAGFSAPGGTQSLLRRLAVPSALERHAQAVALFQNEIKASAELTQPVKDALSALTDQGMFKLNDLDEQIKQLNAELSQSNIQVSPEVLETAESYKRAIYEMMRGSLESGSRDSIRDVVIPACYGLPQGKLSKDQQAQIDKYEKLLEATAEARFKDTKLLTTQSQTLKEQIAQICAQFDGQTLKQLRDRVFNGLVKINALELNQTVIISRKLAYQKQKELLQQKQKYAIQFQLLREQVDANIKYITEEVIQKYHISINAITDALAYFNQTVEKYILLPDQQLREFLKKPVRAAQLIQQIRQFLNTDNRNKVKQALLQQPGNPDQAKIVEEFYGQYQNYLLEDGMGAFKQCQANYEKYIQNFFDALSPVGTLGVGSYSALLNEPVFPDAVSCRNASLRNLLGAFQIVYQTPYLAIFSKIIPIESDIKCTHQQQLRVYDALRAVKSIAAIVQLQQKERLAQAQELVAQLEALKAAMGECHTFDTGKDIAGIKKHFCDQYVLALFREGQIEYQRGFEAINDMRLISYKVDTDGNVLQTTQPNNPNVHEDENIIMRDDSQFLVVDKNYLEKQINENLVTKYHQLNDKLTELSKVHARIRNLQSECKITSQRTENTINETKDFQMIRVSKDMLEIIRHNASNESRKQQELKILQNKILHSKKSQETMLMDRQAQLERIPLEMQRLQAQNNQLLQQIEEAEAKNQQREQAIPDFVDEAEEANYAEDAALFMNLEQKYARLRALKNPAGRKTMKQTTMTEENEETDKKFRRIAALRKMRELRTAQEEEMKFLLTELDRLRKKTYIQFE